MTALVMAPRINRARMDLGNEFSLAELCEALRFYGMISNKRFIRILLKFGVLVRNASGTLSFFRGKGKGYIPLRYGTPVYYKRLETCLDEYYSRKSCLSMSRLKGTAHGTRFPRYIVMGMALSLKGCAISTSMVSSKARKCVIPCQWTISSPSPCSRLCTALMALSVWMARLCATALWGCWRYCLTVRLFAWVTAMTGWTALGLHWNHVSRICYA